MIKKRLHYVLFLILILSSLFAAGFLICRRLRFLHYIPETLEESADTLKNPYIGWYKLSGYLISDDTPLHLPDTASQSENTPAANTALSEDADNNASASLILLEFNLKNYADRDLSHTALNQLDSALAAWQTNGNQLILRFLYDWDGKNLETEPDNLEQILRHMEQVAPVVNRYADCVYLMQGIFVGNWGEMNNSAWLSSENRSILIQTLSDLISPDIFLSVRTPAQLRSIVQSAKPLGSSQPFDGSLPARLGLFNDGMLGSGNDTGTYGDTAASASDYQSAWLRQDELDFQNELCRYVPNGGEVIIDNAFNDPETADASLEQMHVSYLNQAYDPAVLTKWKNSPYTGSNSVYSGLSFYDYVTCRLGYRYVIRDSFLQLSPLANEAQFSVSIENTGFSVSYRSFDITLNLVSDSGEVTSVPLDADPRFWDSGSVSEVKTTVDVRSLPEGFYTVWLKFTDPRSGLEILPASTAEHGDSGSRIGSFTLSRLHLTSEQ